MMTSYLTLLEESLHKKIEVLQKIEDYNNRQQETFKSPKPDMDQFDAAVEEKGKLIERVELLDKGFESMYEKVSQELQGHREEYADQIATLQKLIKEVTDLSVTIQAQEIRNKKLIEDYFAGQRDGIKKGRMNSKAAINYYRTMNNPASVTSRAFDDKK